MSKKVTNDDFLNRFELVGNKNILILGDYINAKTKIVCKCKVCNYEWESFPANLTRGHGCIKCASKERNSKTKKTHEQYQKELHESGYNIEVIDEYIDGLTNILHKCLICNHEWKARPANILIGKGCPKCAGRNKTNDEFIQEFNIVNNNLIELLSPYMSSHDKIKCRCKVCGNQWEALPYSLLHGSGCQKCADNKRAEKNTISHDEFISRLKQINKNIVPLDNYNGMNNKIRFYCKTCNNIWETTPHYILLPTAICSHCSSSKGETKISKYLDNNNIVYIQQQKYDGLVGVNGGKLSYDFYLPQYNLLIEFQGEQHIKAREFFGGEEQLKIQQEHDRRKREYAEKNNINLLEIWYYDINNIESILLQTINEIKENNLKLESVETTGVA